MWYAAIYNKKPNYIIEYRYYWELARTLAGGFLKADHVLRNLKVSENLVPSNRTTILSALKLVQVFSDIFPFLSFHSCALFHSSEGINKHDFPVQHFIVKRTP